MDWVWQLNIGKHSSRWIYNLTKKLILLINILILKKYWTVHLKYIDMLRSFGCTERWVIILRFYQSHTELVALWPNQKSISKIMNTVMVFMYLMPGLQSLSSTPCVTTSRSVGSFSLHAWVAQRTVTHCQVTQNAWVLSVCPRRCSCAGGNVPVGLQRTQFRQSITKNL